VHSKCGRSFTSLASFHTAKDVSLSLRGKLYDVPSCVLLAEVKRGHRGRH